MLMPLNVNNQHQSTSPALTASTSDPFTFQDILTWCRNGKRVIAISTFGTMLITAGIALLMPNIYTARATLLPPSSQQQGGAGAALAALGALSGGLLSTIGSKTPDEQYVAILKSRTIARKIDAQLKLRERHKMETMEEYYDGIQTFVRITGDRKSGVITIEADDKEPEFSAILANSFAAELDRILDEIALTDAKKRLQYFEKQLATTKHNLAAAEEAMQITVEKTGAIALDAQAEQLLVAAATLRSQVTMKEIELRVKREVATTQNPEVASIQAELVALRSELARLEGKESKKGLSISAAQLPKTATDIYRSKRELKFQEVMFEGLVKQYEAARLDAASEGPSIQIIDIAQAPDRKSKPARSAIVLIAAFIAFVVSLLSVIGKGSLRHRSTTPI